MEQKEDNDSLNGTILWWADDSPVVTTVVIYLVSVVGEGWVSTATQVISRKESSTTASTGSGDQSSILLSSTSGRTTTRFGVGSPEGDDANAMPSLVISETGERIPLADGNAVNGSEFIAKLVRCRGCRNEITVIKLDRFACAWGNGFIRIPEEVEITYPWECDSSRAWYPG